MLAINHPTHQTLINAAYDFARKAHDGQVRKYTGEPYINHPVEVAKIVATVSNDWRAICAALLHDVIEDCGVTRAQLAHYFGDDVADMVMELSDVSKPENGNRALRKTLDLMHTSLARPLSKTVKLADLISNSRSIIEHDKGFAVVYMKEKSKMLGVLTDGDKALHGQCMMILTRWLSRSKS